MKKKLIAVLSAVTLVASLWTPLFAQSDDDEVVYTTTPRYTGFALGAYLMNDWLLFDGSTFGSFTLGGGLALEYTMPFLLPFNADWGLSLHVDYERLFPKEGSSLSATNDINGVFGLWMRFPFVINDYWFAFQPEIAGGVVTHLDSSASFDPLIRVTPSFRYIPQSIPQLELELAPQFAISPKSDEVLMLGGVRLGGVWHFSKPVKQEIQQKEISYPLETETFTDFTPDGDGTNDKVTVVPKFTFLDKSTEGWTLQVYDPAGNPFRKISGSGNLPKKIVWNGKGDDGSLVYSNNTYTMTLTANTSKLDYLQTGLETVESNYIVKTGTILEALTKNEWRVSVQSIRFDPNAASLTQLSDEEREEMDSMLGIITDHVMSMENSHITVYGYANNVSNTQKEQEEELLPLSKERAEMIASLLVEKGIPEERISVEAMGGENPIAAWEDTANWWKNRRIEFLIVREVKK